MRKIISILILITFVVIPASALDALAVRSASQRFEFRGLPDREGKSAQQRLKDAQACDDPEILLRQYWGDRVKRVREGAVKRYLELLAADEDIWNRTRPMIEAMTGPKATVIYRRTACYSLRYLYPKFGVIPAARLLIDVIANNRELYQRGEYHTAGDYLAEIVRNDGEEEIGRILLAALEKSLSEAESEINSEATGSLISAIGKARISVAEGKLVTILKTHPEFYIKYEAALALGLIGDLTESTKASLLLEINPDRHKSICSGSDGYKDFIVFGIVRAIGMLSLQEAAPALSALALQLSISFPVDYDIMSEMDHALERIGGEEADRALTLLKRRKKRKSYVGPRRRNSIKPFFPKLEKAPIDNSV